MEVMQGVAQYRTNQQKGKKAYTYTLLTIHQIL